MGNQKVGGFFNNAFYTENTFYEKDSVDILPSNTSPKDFLTSFNSIILSPPEI